MMQQTILIVAVYIAVCLLLMQAMLASGDKLKHETQLFEAEFSAFQNCILYKFAERNGGMATYSQAGECKYERVS